MYEVISFLKWNVDGKGTAKDNCFELDVSEHQDQTVVLTSSRRYPSGVFKLIIETDHTQQGGVQVNYDITYYGQNGWNTGSTQGTVGITEKEKEIEGWPTSYEADIKLTVRVTDRNLLPYCSYVRIILEGPIGSNNGDYELREGLMKLRVGRKTPNALMLSEARSTVVGDFDFANDWVINPEQTGVRIENGRIVVEKVKPNIWFIRSNYDFTTDAQRNEKFLNKLFTLKGLADNSPLIRRHSSNGYSQQGLVVSPCDKNGNLFCNSYPWEMNIQNGSFKWPNEGALIYGFTYNIDRGVLYDYAVPNTKIEWWDGGCYEVGFAFCTDHATGSDGFLELQYGPLTIESGESIFEPASREGYKAAYGKVLVYDKVKTFENCLMRHELAFEEKGNFVELVQGSIVPIQKSDWQRLNRPVEDPIAFVVTDRQFDYPAVRFPVPEDLELLIAKGYPMKFWASKETPIPGKPNFGEAVVNAFKKIVISDNYYAQNLFTNSNVKGGDDYVELNFNIHNSGGDIYEYISLDGCFDHSSVDNVRIRVLNGYVTSLRNVFRQAMDLKSVVFLNESGDERACLASQWAGAFEYCTLPAFPKGLGAMGREKGCTEQTCQISYAFHGTKMPSIGNLKSEVLSVDDGIMVLSEDDRFDTWNRWSVVSAEISLPQSRLVFSRSGEASTNFEQAGTIRFSVEGVNNSEGQRELTVSFVNRDGSQETRNYTDRSEYLLSFNPGTIKFSVVKDVDTEMNPVIIQLLGGEFWNEPSIEEGDNRYTMLVYPFCEYAFDSWTGNEIKFLLDFKFVDPDVDAKNVLNCPNLVSARIKNLNKGDWSLDGMVRASGCHGNLRSLDETSVNYLLSNLYDLKKNSGAVEDKDEDGNVTEFRKGVTSATIYLPSVLQTKAHEESLETAGSRGWTVVFG